MMETVAVIPARLASSRLPGKVLADIGGKPLLQHVWDRVSEATRIDDVIVATDSLEVAAVVRGWGGKAILTDSACQSGTERIASILDLLNTELILNVQADEALLDPGMLDTLVESWWAAPCDLITPVYRIRSLRDLSSPKVVKVIRALDGRALYFSRSPIPYVRDWPMESWLNRHVFWGHVGVYGYRRDTLANYTGLPSSALEQAESLEQLRFLEAGLAFQTLETAYSSVAVDTEEDLEEVRGRYAGDQNQSRR